MSYLRRYLLRCNVLLIRFYFRPWLKFYPLHRILRASGSCILIRHWSWIFCVLHTSHGDRLTRESRAKNKSLNDETKFHLFAQMGTHPNPFVSYATKEGPLQRVTSQVENTFLTALRTSQFFYELFGLKQNINLFRTPKFLSLTFWT